MGKTFITAIATMIACLSLTSCYSPEKELRDTIEETNRTEMPMIIDEGLAIETVEIVGNYVIYNAEASENILGDDFIDNLKLHKEYLKDEIICDFINDSDSDIEAMINLCRKAKKGIAYKYTGVPSGKSITIEIEIDELRSDYPCKTPEEKLNYLINKTRTELPYQEGIGLTINEIEIIDGYITYITDADEDILDENFIDILNEKRKELKEDLIESLKSEIDEMIDLCKQTNTGIAYKYVGNHTGKSFTVKIKADEF